VWGGGGEGGGMSGGLKWRGEGGCKFSRGGAVLGWKIKSD
jgi:hypothetical protein